MFLVLSTKKIKKVASWLFPALVVLVIIIMALVRIINLSKGM